MRNTLKPGEVDQERELWMKHRFLNILSILIIPVIIVGILMNIFGSDLFKTPGLWIYSSHIIILIFLIIFSAHYKKEAKKLSKPFVLP